MSLTRNAHPIRLTQENGNITELMATSIDINVTRKIGAKPVPFNGSSRFGLDMNLNQSSIVIQGFFADDGENVNVATAANAKLDFARTSLNTPFFTKKNMLAASGASVTPENNSVVNFLHIPTQTDTYRTIKLKFVTETTSINSGGVYAAHSGSNAFVSVHYDNLVAYGVNTISLWLTQTQQFATAIAACINASADNHFTASVVDGNKTDMSVASNCAVNILQNTAGVVPKTEVVADGIESSDVYRMPNRTNFTGGKNSLRKSAGDKVMDMYGVLNNSKRNSRSRNIVGGGVTAGAAGAAFGPVGFIGGLLIGGLSGEALNNFGPELVVFKEGDYYIGLQIPYNSMVQTTDGSYVARNFMMPVGRKPKEGNTNKPFGTKGSEHNTKSANVVFSEDDYTTGITGSIEKLDISYSAGEQIYLYNMVFKAIDLML